MSLGDRVQPIIGGFRQDLKDLEHVPVWRSGLPAQMGILWLLNNAPGNHFQYVEHLQGQKIVCWGGSLYARPEHGGNRILATVMGTGWSPALRFSHQNGKSSGIHMRTVVESGLEGRKQAE